MARVRLVTTIALSLVVAAAPGVARADNGSAFEKAPQVRVLDSTVATPLQLAYGKSTLLVSDGVTKKVSKLTGKGLKEVLTAPDGLAAVGINARGDLAYGIQQEAGGATTRGDLVIQLKNGRTRTVDLLAHDRTENPDGSVTYGIDNPTPCQQQAFQPLGGANYPGQTDSNPFAVAPVGNDAWVVADAGGNDLLKVDNRGRVSTIAVLPRQPHTITTDEAAALGLPACVVGAVYNFEPLPTDVEVLDDGLVVSLLPGGPEDPGAGARGSVNHVSWRGRTTPIAGGFHGATNLAVDADGDIYVAEVFSQKISRVHRGKVTKYLDLPNVVSLQWARGTLYAGTLSTSSEPGTIVAIR